MKAIIQKVVKNKHIYWIILALKLIQNIVDAILDYFFEFKTETGWRKDRERALYDYEVSAQVVTILARGAYNPVWELGPNNYLYLNEKYTHPNIVLKHDHITLQACTPTHAIFAMTKPGADVYDMNKIPFVMVAQHYKARQLIFVPLWACVQLANEMGDPASEVDIIVIGNSSRSGSTLLTKMFHYLPDTVAMSEPAALCHIHRWYNSSSIRERDLPKFVLALCRLQFKPFLEKKVKTIVFKGVSQITPLNGLMAKVFPCIKLFFNCRHPKNSMISYFHTVLNSPSIKPMLQYQYHNFFLHSLPFDYESVELQELQTKLIRKTRIIPVAKGLAYNYGGTVDYYLRHKGIYRCCILYEDLIADAEDEFRRLLRVLGLSEDLVSYGLEAMKTHSQGKFGNRFKNKKIEKTPIEDKDFEVINQAFTDIHLPLNTNMSVESFKKLFQD